jgi:predicted component of type VI protein secretion system
VIELLLEAERAMSFGRLDRAGEIYEQVAEADPKNSIAVVGLARVALERGDDLSSYLLARRALGIDPENEAALRLAVRLEEVLATRGEPVADPLGATPMDATNAAKPDPRAESVPSAPTAAAEPVVTSATDASRPPVTASPVPPTSPPGAHIPKRSTKRRSLLDRIRRK